MSAGIGEVLREAREARGLSLDDAASETRIRSTHLASIEREDFDALDSDVYTRGFIRNYAKAVGADPEPLVAAFDEQRGSTRPEPAHAQADSRPLAPEPMTGGRRRGAGIIVAALAVVGLIAIALWDGDGADDPEAPVDDGLVVDEPDADEDEDDDDEDEDDADDEPADDGDADEDDEADDDVDADDNDADEDDAEEPDELAVEVTIADGESWFQVLADDEELFQSTEAAGWSETIEADESISMCLGNPAPVEITVHDEVYDDLGPSGQPTWVTITVDGVETERGCQA